VCCRYGWADRTLPQVWLKALLMNVHSNQGPVPPTVSTKFLIPLLPPYTSDFQVERIKFCWNAEKYPPGIWKGKTVVNNEGNIVSILVAQRLSSNAWILNETEVFLNAFPSFFMRASKIGCVSGHRYVDVWTRVFLFFKLTAHWNNFTYDLIFLASVEFRRPRMVA